MGDEIAHNVTKFGTKANNAWFNKSVQRQK